MIHNAFASVFALGLLLLIGCKPKDEPVKLTPAPEQTSAAAKSSGYHFGVSQAASHFSLTIAGPDGKESEFAQSESEPQLNDSSSKWSLLRIKTKEGGDIDYFLAKDSGKVVGPIANVLAFNPSQNLFAVKDGSGNALFYKLGGDSARYLSLRLQHKEEGHDAVSAVLALDSNRISLVMRTESLLVCTAFNAASAYSCAAPAANGVCPALTPDFDGDGKPDTLQLVSIDHPLAFPPAKAMENPFGVSSPRYPEKLVARVRLSGDPAREYLLYDSAYFDTPTWHNRDTRVQNLSVHAKSDMPFPEVEGGAEGGAQPKGDLAGFPTESGEDILLYFDGSQFRTFAMGDDGD